MLCFYRFKKQAFRKPEAATWAVGKLKDELNRLENQQQTEAQQVPKPRKSSSLWANYDEAAQNSESQSGPGIDKVSVEVVSYLTTKNIDREKSLPLEWWKNVGKKQYPGIYKIACKYLCIPATSVPSEQVFSAG